MKESLKNGLGGYFLNDKQSIYVIKYCKRLESRMKGRLNFLIVHWEIKKSNWLFDIG